MRQSYTKGPWHWRRFGDNLALTTTHSGSLIVMDFVRKGFQNAEPRFGMRSDGMGGLMIKASHLLSRDIDHPDARLLAAAPELLECCKLLRDRLQLLAGDDQGSDEGAFKNANDLIRRLELPAEVIHV